ncbi:hypothetical protein FMUAM8_50590 [Nocardia cyriacigeorgica]|nr:hypothetical protein FMUAM8_50590 [Nocardia cyriacigeorgica]BDU08688.1 hypothetical protein FMUBM48_49510 [Nocardia cyriacigeorgica]
MGVAVALQIGAAQPAAVDDVHRIDPTANTAQPRFEHRGAQQTGEPGQPFTTGSEISMRLSGISFQCTELRAGFYSMPRGATTRKIADHLPFTYDKLYRRVPATTGG